MDSDQIMSGEGSQGKGRGVPMGRTDGRSHGAGVETARGGRKVGNRQGPGRVAHEARGQDNPARRIPEARWEDGHDWPRVLSAAERSGEPRKRPTGINTSWACSNLA